MSAGRPEQWNGRERDSNAVLVPKFQPTSPIPRDNDARAKFEELFGVLALPFSNPERARRKLRPATKGGSWAAACANHDARPGLAIFCKALQGCAGQRCQISQCSYRKQCRPHCGPHSRRCHGHEGQPCFASARSPRDLVPSLKKPPFHLISTAS